MDNPNLIPTKLAAPRVGLKPRTLEHWRWRGIGPDYTRVGARIMYDPRDLDAWLATRKVKLNEPA